MDENRFDRQLRAKSWGKETQELVGKKSVLVVGAGGLGSHSVSLLVRLGFGRIVVVDSDVVEVSNLPRVNVFDSDDVGKSKAVVLAQKASRIGGPSVVLGKDLFVDEESIEGLFEGIDIVVDATDNIKTRLLLNRECVKRKVLFVYAGLEESSGMVLGVIPGLSACLECLRLSPEKKDAGVPVIGSVPGLVAGLQISEVVSLLSGKKPLGLVVMQCFESLDIEIVEVKRRSDCPVCGEV
mgnify:CR=1 FL=1